MKFFEANLTMAADKHFTIETKMTSFEKTANKHTIKNFIVEKCFIHDIFALEKA